MSGERGDGRLLVLRNFRGGQSSHGQPLIHSFAV